MVARSAHLDSALPLDPASPSVQVTGWPRLRPVMESTSRWLSATRAG